MVNLRRYTKIKMCILGAILIVSLFLDDKNVSAEVTVSGNLVPVSEEVPAIMIHESEDMPVINVDSVPEDEEETTEEEVEGADESGNNNIAVAKVTGVSVAVYSYKALKINFLSVGDVDGYEIYRGTNKKKMKRIADVGANKTSYVDMGKKALTTNKKYYYKIRAYVYNSQNKKVYGEYSKIVAGKPKLDIPIVKQIKSVNYKSVSLVYSKVSGASGYVIYRSAQKDAGFKKIGVVKNGKTTKYTDEKCKTGLMYYYKVRAYRTVSGKNMHGGCSEIVKMRTSLDIPKLNSAKAENADTAVLTWKEVSGASGYRIYRSKTKNGKYKKVADAEGGKNVQIRVKGQENGETYYYKVRAYRLVDGKRKYTSYSNVKKAVFNILGSSKETYSEKAQRIFGKDYYVKYSSEDEAELYMVEITVPVWDLGADGVTKVTKQRSLTVHENIADTVKQIFQEIYDGEEKFPIKNVSGYSWRGDTSTSEHCCGLAIDINWEENYLIDNGAIISGKLYLPGVNPYSIPTDGEVAKIMNKYGFTQGLWGKRCDYMHFSYFGT